MILLLVIFQAIILTISHSVILMYSKRMHYPYSNYYNIFLQTAATHTNNINKDSIFLTWVAPPAGIGAIIFRCFIIVM